MFLSRLMNQKLIIRDNMAKDIRRRSYGPNLRNPHLRKRAILKNGEYNIIKPKFTKRYLRYVKDLFTSLVDAEWKWTVQVIAIGFVGVWLIFALLWWLIAFVHTDLWDEHLPARQIESGWTPCVLNIYGFHSCFLYSLETQHTTGYGGRAITEECPEAIFLLCAQCIIGMIIDSFTVGVMFAKLTRPTLSASTLQFSKNGVVCLRDGLLHLMFRVGTIKKSRLVGVSVRAILIHKTKSKEGEILDDFTTPLEVECDESGSNPVMLWPEIIFHKIDESSPFYRMTAIELLEKRFEIILVVEGTTESTGQGTHAKTSYIGEEILWGRQFEPMVEYNGDMDCYEANYLKFDWSFNVRTPLCSAAELEEIGIENAVMTDEKTIVDPETYSRQPSLRKKARQISEILKYESGLESRNEFYAQNLRQNGSFDYNKSKECIVSENGVSVQKRDERKSPLRITWV